MYAISETIEGVGIEKHRGRRMGNPGIHRRLEINSAVISYLGREKVRTSWRSISVCTTGLATNI